MTGWWQLKDFLNFHPEILGNWSKLTTIFQRGWNHQLVFFSSPLLDWLENFLIRPGDTDKGDLIVSTKFFSQNPQVLHSCHCHLSMSKKIPTDPWNIPRGFRKKYQDFLHKQVFLRVFQGMFQGSVGIFWENGHGIPPFALKRCWNYHNLNGNTITRWNDGKDVDLMLLTFWSKTVGLVVVKQHLQIWRCYIYTFFKIWEKNHGLKKL